MIWVGSSEIQYVDDLMLTMVFMFVTNSIWITCKFLFLRKLNRNIKFLPKLIKSMILLREKVSLKIISNVGKYI